MKLILAAMILLIATPARIEAQTPRSRRLNTQGYRLYKRGALARAKVKFEQALGADSANLLAGYNLGCTLCRLGKLTEAQAYLRFVLRGDTGGTFARRMGTDTDLKKLQASGVVKRMVAASGLSADDRATITGALASGRPNHAPSSKAPVLTTDLDGDGKLEAFWWVQNGDLSLDTQLIAATQHGGGLKVTLVRGLSSYFDGGSLLAAGKGLGLLVSAFSASHNSSEIYSAVRVEKGVVTPVWDHTTSLEVTCLMDDCKGHTDANDQIDFTLVNLDRDPTPELVMASTSDCALRTARVKVLDLRRGRLRPMRGARRALARRLAALRPLILKGDDNALEQQLHIAPGDHKRLRSLIKALRTARDGTPQAALLDRLVERYASSATRRALKRLGADPLLKKRVREAVDGITSGASCSASFTGQSY